MQHTEDEKGIWTHAYECRNSKRIWYVTLVGTFYKTENLARQLIAEQMHAFILRTWSVEDLEGVTVERCKGWLNGLHHMDPGSVTMVSTAGKEGFGFPRESGKLRSQATT